MKKHYNRLLFQILITFILININYVLSQTCDPGFTFNSAMGACKAPGDSILHTVMCTLPGEVIPTVFIGNSLQSPCPAGAVTTFSNWDYITTNKVTIYYCTMEPTNMNPFYSLLKKDVAPCAPGYPMDYIDTLPREWWVNELVFSGTNLYLINLNCYSVAYGYNAFQVLNSLPSPPANYAEICRAKDYSLVESYLVSWQSWSWGETRCPIGTVGTYPSCTTCSSGFVISNGVCVDVNECASAACGSATCTNTIGSYQCSCPVGYSFNIGSKSCIDNNECLDTTICGSATCANTPGTYQCKCPIGYSYNTGSKSCVDIDECVTTPTICGTAACVNSAGSYQCNCPVGYSYNTASKSCVDVNECVTTPNICGSATCANLAGTYQCNCPVGYSYNSGSKSCVDINECKTTPTICGSATCLNSVGSYQCSCPAGHNYNSATKNCVDIDECLSNKGGCQQICSNTVGSFECSCNSGYTKNQNLCEDINECQTITPNVCGTSKCNNSIGSYNCFCDSGYSLSNDLLSCNDIDECKTQSPCTGLSSCVNIAGYFYCTCPIGYKLSSNKLSCDEIDECLLLNPCKGNSICANTIGNYTCSCPNGYELNSDQISCKDIDECNVGTDGCISVATCQNSVGSFQCICPSGYTLNGKSCNDINECLIGNGGCQHNCTNLNGSFECSCNSGYLLSTVDNKSCDDINECSIGNGGCQHTCSNSIGSFECSCDSGYILNTETGKKCDDINECLIGNGGCQHTCSNSFGSFNCLCDSGYLLNTETSKTCDDINECLSSTTNQCSDNTICENINSTYTCQCNPKQYSHNTPFTCVPKPTINEFYQNPNQFYTFTVFGHNFVIDGSATIFIGSNQCNYISGTETQIECSIKQGTKVGGNVTVESNSILSDPFFYIGAPFINGYLPSNPPTNGGLITFTGSNFPVLGDIKMFINSMECPISLITSQSLECTISEGSGGFNQVKLSNETVSNTDLQHVTYANPFITSTSQLYANGGILTIYGRNFGTSKSLVTIDIGHNDCNNVIFVSHIELTCEIEPTTNIETKPISLVVDSLPVENVYYFTYSTLDAGECESSCNGNGLCTPYGCVCKEGLKGVSCNETTVEIVPKPPLVDIPSMEIGTNNTNNGYGYKVSIIKIEELNLNGQVVTSFNLLEEKWGKSHASSSNQWIFNITLPNESYLESTFEYFKQTSNISFAGSSFIIPSESLKLSFKTVTWPFESKLNTLRIIIKTETLLLSEDVSECAIDNPKTTNYNQHVWSTQSNPETGIVARFISLAMVDNIPIRANIEILDNDSQSSSIIGISLPYFRTESIIDPDFGLLLNVDNVETGNCNSKSSANWKIGTGVAIGGVAAVGLSAATAFAIKQNKKKKQFLNSLNRNK